MAFDMYDCARDVVRSGIRNRRPDATRVEVEQELFLRFYGRDFTPEQTAVILDRIATAHAVEPAATGAGGDA